MIDSQQIEELLKTTKLGSITDVIHFILDNIIKVINFQPIHDLAARVAELEKPQGLDSIMLQQAKALIEAIVEQKQDQIRRDLQKTVHNNLTLAIQQQNTRRSLKEFDLMQIMSNQNIENIQKCAQNIQNKSPSFNFQQQTQYDLIRRQISDLKNLLQRKSDRRQFNDLKIQIQKQLSNKMTINDTEKIVQKFQRDVFIKLSETNNSLQKIQYQIKKSLLNQVSLMKKQLNESTKMIELKQKMTKLQKKVKKISAQCTDNIKLISSQVKNTQKQSKQSVQQICSLIQNIDCKIKTNSQTIKTLSTKFYMQDQKMFENAAWSAENKINVKNMAISWEKQLGNQNEQIFKFELGKSQIVITQPGFYCIQSCVFGCQKAPQLYLNSQAYTQFQQNTTNKYTNFIIKTTIKMSQNVNKIWVRLNNQTNYTQALLRISKVG